MAVVTKKDKLIEEAQKSAARGQFDKAAKAYEQILEIDPSAINLRQKLAELLIKCGRSDDARKELETIGKHFSKNGFYLKAIAVYKQLQKLFPADISLSLTLAELNEKHGLVANALSEYKTVYAFHEKSGNTADALAILDRMQAVDPQNIPIKIKLAEAYILQGKLDQSYAVFMKTASLLVERNDFATLSKISTRVQQLFPGKSDFLLEVLAEQIDLGNAAATIDSLQGLLRSNPKNKRIWELIIKAYQQAGQPQRVKIACQHFLNFFPAEPAAMHGLIASATTEMQLSEALDLLGKYETALISANYLPQLEQIYHSLDKIDPINIRITEGLIRVATAAGNETEVSSLNVKLNSLRSVSGTSSSPEPEAPPADFDDTSADAAAVEDSPFYGDSFSEGIVADFNIPEESLTPDTPTETMPSGIEAELPEEDFEIDIDIDIDSPFDTQDDDISADSFSTPDNWLDSVGKLFDTIDTSPRGVKFGSEMDSSDAQSHFDLGQAFKEMGLYDEAINEFRQASQDPARRVECLIMQCICLRERGELDKAATMLLALLKPGLSEEESCSVKYELATGYEAAGRVEEANILLNEIMAVNPGFRDISSRINAANITDSLDFSDDDLDGFGLK